MAEGRRKRNLTELTGNELTVQNTKHVKSVEESANSIVGEQKGVVSNVKHAALGTSKNYAALNTKVKGFNEKRIGKCSNTSIGFDLIVHCYKCKKKREVPKVGTVEYLNGKWYCALMTWVRSEDAHCEYEGETGNYYPVETPQISVVVGEHCGLDSTIKESFPRIGQELTDEMLSGVEINYPKSPNILEIQYWGDMSVDQVIDLTDL